MEHAYGGVAGRTQKDAFLDVRREEEEEDERNHVTFGLIRLRLFRVTGTDLQCLWARPERSAQRTGNLHLPCSGAV